VPPLQFSPGAWGRGSYISNYELGVVFIVPPPGAATASSAAVSALAYRSGVSQAQVRALFLMMAPSSRVELGLDALWPS